MAFDGIVIASLTRELGTALTGGRITKIAQPEKDELLFTIKNYKESYRLLLSASASLPLAYLTSSNKQSPMTAPNFCMLLRKHIGNARILSVTQPEMERVICFEMEHLDELGDLCKKFLYVELMGKHSNLIFCRDDNTIIDSIKHISAQVSSVREVLPGRPYFIPQTTEKRNPLQVTKEHFTETIHTSFATLQKSIYTSFTGFSPIMAEELCHLASLESDRPANELSDTEVLHLYHTFSMMAEDIREGNFTPNIIFCKDEPVEFAAFPLTCLSGGDYHAQSFTSTSALLETYFAARSTVNRIRQKSVDLRKIIQTLLERSYKKYDLQLKQLKDTEKREKYKIYGELLNSFGYELEGGEKEFICQDYHSGDMVRIPLDPQLSARENAQKHFDRYSKLKRTSDALTQLTLETKAEIDHLESISSALDIARKEEDLVQIKEEMMEFGYIRRKGPAGKKVRVTSRPFHYLSSDGFHIYVGKNNYQNEEVTFKLATGNDWWFHAKGMPGSHVIVKTDGKELPDRTFEEAGALAAYYSKGRDADKVEIDYIQKKHVKKAAGGAPGFVIYHTNYSMLAEPQLLVQEVTETTGNKSGKPTSAPPPPHS